MKKVTVFETDTEEIQEELICNEKEAKAIEKAYQNDSFYSVNVINY
jgi:hypothetical protein